MCGTPHCRYGCPANLLRIPPAPGTLAALVAYVALQVPQDYAASFSAQLDTTASRCRLTVCGAP